MASLGESLQFLQRDGPLHISTCALNHPLGLVEHLNCIHLVLVVLECVKEGFKTVLNVSILGIGIVDDVVA